MASTHAASLTVNCARIPLSLNESRCESPFCWWEMQQKTATIESMQIAILGMRLLEVMFFVGLVGSTVVVLISFVEDAKELFGDE